MNAPAVTARCSCGHTFQVSGSQEGEKVTCPACKKPFRVPASLPVAKSKQISPPTSRKPGSTVIVPPPPDLIPGYLIQKRLGSGGMGDVYLAKQQSLDRMVALKLLPEELAKDKMFVETFMKEARSAAKVSHENIVGAVDFGEANGRYYFVMEKVEGETLFRIIRKRGALPEARALDFARQIAHGLRHAHKHGLIHRDIKPQNIMVTPEGKAKILDFGLARDVRKEKNAGRPEFVVSTPAYASPEQCTGEAGIDHRTDIYSLGVTLFEMLTGRRPFTADTARRIMNKQVSDAPPPPQTLHKGISPEANDLVLRLLRKNPAERFQSYDKLIAAIDEVAGGVEPAPPASEGPTPLRKRPPVLIGAAAGVVLVVVVLIFAFSGGEEKLAPAAPVLRGPSNVRNPEVMKVLDQTREMERRARKPSQWAGVLARWRELEKMYRGTPHHGKFTGPMVEYEDSIKEKADVIAMEYLSDAKHQENSGKLAGAYDALARFPKILNFTAAHRRIAARKLGIERAMDRAFQNRMREVEEIALNDRFEEARNLLLALRSSLSVLGPTGEKDVFARYSGPMDDLLREIDAARKAAGASTPVVGATPRPGVTPGTTPDATPNPGAGPVKPIVDPPSDLAPEIAAHFAVLHAPAQRGDAAGRASALKFFESVAGKSALYAAARVFLTSDERMWMLQGKVGEALDAYLPRVIVPNAESIDAGQHRTLLAQLGRKIQECGDVPVHALQLFACAHIRELLDKKESVDPALAMQARLGQAAISKSWGPSQHVARVEMAGMLVRRPGLWLPRAADASAGAPDFATRYLGALCVVKQASVPATAAEKAWRDLAANAPNPEWSDVCEKVADRLKRARSCEICDAKGRYPCGFCSATGAVPCPTCNATGFVVVGADPVKKRCSTCRSRRAVACGACNGTRNIKCAACEGKKRRRHLVGSHFRYVVDLAVCPACSGHGTPLPGTGFPCFTCGGNGRALDRVPGEFGRLPSWIAKPEGRAVFLALRWLARHQAPNGTWSPNGWRSACPEKGCSDLSGDGFEVATTSIALLAFLDAGFGPNSKVELGGVKAGEVVRKALAWLLKAQNTDSGHISGGTGGTPKPIFEHLVATYVLSTAALRIQPGKPFGEAEVDQLRQAVHRAAQDALANQVKNGGWRYTPGTESDTWVTCWGAMALLAAREAGVDIPRLHLKYIVRWLDGSTDKKGFFIGYSPSQMSKVSLSGMENYVHHPTLSAFGALARMLIEGKPSASTAAADKLLRADLPSSEPFARDYAYWYAATMYLSHRTRGRGTDWSKWVGALNRQEFLIQEMKDDCSLGSWPGKERWIPMGGRIYAVAMNALTLEYAAGIRPRPVKRR